MSRITMGLLLLASAVFGTGVCAPVMAANTINFSGNKTISTPVTLSDDTVYQGTGNSNITFASTVDGAHSLTVITGGAVSFDDAVGNTSRLGALNISGTGANSFGSAVQAASLVTGTGPVMLRGDVTTTGAQTYNGTVSLDGSSSGNSLSLTASDITFNSTVDNASGLTEPQSLTLHLSGPVATRFNGAIGSNGALGALRVTGAGGGQVQFYGTVHAASLAVSRDAVVFADVTTSGNQTYGGEVQVDNASLTSNGGDIEFQGLLTTSPLMPALTIDAGSGAVKFDSAAYVLGPGATLDVTGKGGISQSTSSVISVSATASFDAGTTGAITLTGANQFNAAVNLTGAATRITNAAPLTLGAVNVASVQAKAGGAITQASGGVTVAGTSSFDAGAHAITLASSNNDFGGAVSLTGDTTTITDANALLLGLLNIGNFTVTSDGALNLGSGTIAGNLSAASNGGVIAQSAALTITGVSNIDGGSGNITLADAANDFMGTVTVSGTDVSMTDKNDLDVTQLTDGSNGAVSLIAGGALALPTGSINTGTADLSLVANGGTLASPGALSGADVSLTGSGDVTLQGAVTAAGTLALVSTHGAVTQQVAAVITAATLTGSSSGATHLLDANMLASLGNFSANGFSLTNGQAMTVAAGTSVDGGAGGTALTTTSGDLVINGALAGTTTTLVSAGATSEGAAGVISAATLTGSSVGGTTLNGANQIDTLGSFSAANLALTNAQALAVVGPLTTSGGLGNIHLVTTSGALHVSAALIGGDVALSSAADLFLSADVSGSQVSLTAPAGTIGAAISTSGGLRVSAAPGVMQVQSSASVTGATHLVDGTLQVDGGASIAAVTVDGGATLTGVGSADAITNHGIVAPGTSGAPYGSLTAASYTDGGGTLRIAADAASGNNSKLSVIGAATLGGPLVVDLGGSQPTAGDSFDVLSANPVNNQFASVSAAGSQIDPKATYSSSKVTVKFGQVIAPYTPVPTLDWRILLVLAALLGVFATLRLRREQRR